MSHGDQDTDTGLRTARPDGLARLIGPDAARSQADPATPAKPREPRVPFLKRIERYFSAFFKLGRTAQSAKLADRSLRQLEPRVDRLSDELFNLGERSADLDHGTHALRDRLAQIEEGQRRIEARLSAVDERIAERVDQRVDALTEAVAEVRSRQAELVEILHRDSARLDRLDGTGERIADLGRDLSDLDGRTRRDAAGLVAEMAATARAYTDLSRRLDLARFRNGEDKRASPPFPTPDRREGLDALLDAFYGRLEDRFRGARDEILDRLRVYLPDVRQAVEATGGRVLDLGCGRGEWVELLTREGIAAEGVDLNPVQISEALSLGLEVREGDALRTLAEAPDNHYAAVTAHHLVEHLPFDTVTWMTREALRVLAPGGVLIYETPNPRNLIVGATTFNIDPTHRRPLPAEVLTTLLDTCGYHPVEARPLHPSDTLEVFRSANRIDPHVAELLFGPQDLAILGVKPGQGG